MLGRGRETFQDACRNCGIPATGSDDYRIGELIGLEVRSSFGYLIGAGGVGRTDCGARRARDGGRYGGTGNRIAAGRGFARWMRAYPVGTGVRRRHDCARQEAARQCALCESEHPGRLPARDRALYRKEAPGTIVVDSDARYLYYVL